MSSRSDDQLSAFVERLMQRSRSDSAYEESLDRAEARVHEVASSVAAQKDAAPVRFAELFELPTSDLARLVALEPRFQTYSLANYTLERCEKALSSAPKLALSMARLARAITVRIDPQTCGGMDALADLGSYALAMEGNAQRVSGHWPAALAAFTRARAVQRQGGSDPDLMARIDMMEASLRRDLGQTREALIFLDRAEEIFLALEDRERYLWARINRANVSLVQEKSDGAASILEEIFGKTDSPQTVLLIRHNLAWAFTQAGRMREAAQLFEENRELYLQFSNPLATNRRLWLEGIIAKGFGQEELAERLLREASADFAERGYTFDAALIRLDLGKLQARRKAEPVC